MLFYLFFTLILLIIIGVPHNRKYLVSLCVCINDAHQVAYAGILSNLCLLYFKLYFNWVDNQINSLLWGSSTAKLCQTGKAVVIHYPITR